MKTDRNLPPKTRNMTNSRQPGIDANGIDRSPKDTRLPVKLTECSYTPFVQKKGL